MGRLGTCSSDLADKGVDPGETRDERAAHARSRVSCQARGVTFSYGNRKILDQVDIGPLAPGSVTALVGPNGTGKSTLLRCLAGLESCTGEVAMDSALYLPQDPPPLSSLTVYESVLLARQQSFAGFAGLRISSKVRADVEETLDQLGLSVLASRMMSQLSGGQRQLVSFAQAVVRRPEVLLLDEPTSALDLRNQLMLLEQVQKYARQLPCAVVMTLHDLAQAARFCSQVLVMSKGRIYSQGKPEEVITEQMLREVYQVQGSVLSTADGGLAVEVVEAI